MTTFQIETPIQQSDQEREYFEYRPVLTPRAPRTNTCKKVQKVIHILIASIMGTFFGTTTLLSVNPNFNDHFITYGLFCVQCIGILYLAKNKYKINIKIFTSCYLIAALSARILSRLNNHKIDGNSLLLNAFVGIGTGIVVGIIGETITNIYSRNTQNREFNPTRSYGLELNP